MRKLLLLFILQASILGLAIAQQADSANHVVVSKEGNWLDKGWKFQTGDNPIYADPTFDDKKWQAVDPTIDVHELPQVWKQIGWFRIKLYLDSTVQSVPLALRIWHPGASEIYVNGKLAYRFGIVSTQADKIIAYDPAGKPLPMQNLHNGKNVLAIRYILQPRVFYTTNTLNSNPVFAAGLGNMNNYIKDYLDENRLWIGSSIFRIGAFFILFILHLAFYFYYPAQRANLYFSVFAMCVVVTDSFQVPIIHGIQEWFYDRLVVIDFLILSTFFLLTAIYSLLKQKRSWIYWSLTALLAVTLLLNAFTYRLGNLISVFVITNLFNLEIARVAYLAVKRKQRGARIIATGTLGFLIIWTVFLLSFPFKYNGVPFISLYTYGHLTFMLAFLSVPVATSIYLGLDFGFTSTSLKQKLQEVETLSKEKQQILESQNETLEQQVAERTKQLNQSLEDLKAAQGQLVQREKMASLGELTAGIAHEIQNPLNFVNNFSAVNKELLEELQQANKKGDPTEVDAIAEDIKANEEKISHHGRRADAIVKGMLQHSSGSVGQKEPTRINLLASEYLKLSYHSLRAKDKSFQATIETYFDESLGKINIVPQEIGRVLLNLFNNAFYAVQQKKEQSNGSFKPVVSVTTKQESDFVIITVMDNGTGIPEKVKDKIFQPFFTTKPTGEGTGLGLSLSYDIVTKGHGGTLSVQSIEGEGSEFVITLPIA